MNDHYKNAMVRMMREYYKKYKGCKNCKHYSRKYKRCTCNDDRINMLLLCDRWEESVYGTAVE